jgi:hypothetical protein
MFNAQWEEIWKGVLKKITAPLIEITNLDRNNVSKQSEEIIKKYKACIIGTLLNTEDLRYLEKTAKIARGIVRKNIDDGCLQMSIRNIVQTLTGRFCELLSDQSGIFYGSRRRWPAQSFFFM